MLRSDALSGILDANFRRFTAALQAERELPARGHRLDGVKNQIEQGLREKRPIDAHGRKIGILFFELDVSAFHLGPGNSATSSSSVVEVRLLEAQLLRAHEIEEAFHDRIQAVDFAIEHGHGLPRHAIAGGEMSP